MADLSTGADAELGDCLASQQYNRLKNLFRNTTEPGSIQPGMLFSRSTDNRLSHRADAENWLIFQGQPVCMGNVVVCMNNEVVVWLPV